MAGPFREDLLLPEGVFLLLIARGDDFVKSPDRVHVIAVGRQIILFLGPHCLDFHIQSSLVELYAHLFKLPHE